MKEWKCKECVKYNTDACFNGGRFDYDNCKYMLIDVDYAYQQGRADERADTIEIVHRFFMDEMDAIETYIDEDDGVSEIYKDQKKAKYLLNLNKRLCTRLKEQK